MAAEDSAQREPESFKNPVLFQGFFGIIRAARIETAPIADERADRPLVYPDQSNEHGFHIMWNKSRIITIKISKNIKMIIVHSRREEC